MDKWMPLDEPHAPPSHTTLTGVASSLTNGLAKGDKFAEVRGPAAEGIGNEAKVVEAIKSSSAEA